MCSLAARAALTLPFERMNDDFEGALRRAHAAAQRQHGIPMTDSKNTILAIVLSAIVLIAWQYFYAMPQAEKQKLAAAAGASSLRRSRPRPRRSPARHRRRQRPAHAAGPRPDRPAGGARRAGEPRRRSGRLAARADRNRRACKARSR